MTVFKSDCTPPFMESEEADLNHEKIQYAVSKLSFQGLQAAATLALVTWNKLGRSPADFCRLMESL